MGEKAFYTVPLTRWQNDENRDYLIIEFIIINDISFPSIDHLFQKLISNLFTVDEFKKHCYMLIGNNIPFGHPTICNRVNIVEI